MITKFFYQLILIIAFALFMQIPAYANCSKSYTVGFFNGVWNTNDQANLGRDKLRILIGDTYNNQPVKYKAFYNHTGKSVGATALQDLAETFIQRSNEVDKSGEFGKRFEYFWEFLGASKPTFVDKLKGAFPHLAGIFDAYFTAIVTKLVAVISYIYSNPPTEADYASHNAKLDTLAANGEKLMLVAHSQGNLFVNHAYDHIRPVVGKDRVAVAHIAPASPTLRGDYLLADIDIVINAMRLQGINSVPDTNLPLPFSKADASGHTLIGTYLDETREGRGKVKMMIETGMGGLKCRSPIGSIALMSYYFTADTVSCGIGLSNEIIFPVKLYDETTNTSTLLESISVHTPNYQCTSDYWPQVRADAYQAYVTLFYKYKAIALDQENKYKNSIFYKKMANGNTYRYEIGDFTSVVIDSKVPSESNYGLPKESYYGMQFSFYYELLAITKI